MHRLDARVGRDGPGPPLALPRTNGDVLAVEAVLRQQLTGLHLDQVDQLRVVHEIDTC